MLLAVTAATLLAGCPRTPLEASATGGTGARTDGWLAGSCNDLPLSPQVEDPCGGLSSATVDEWARCGNVPVLAAVELWEGPWSHLGPSPPADRASATWSDGRMLVFLENALTVTAIRLSDGTRVWSAQLPPPEHRIWYSGARPPVAAGGRLVVAVDSTVAMLGASTGVIAWTTSVDGITFAGPLINGSEVIVAVEDVAARERSYALAATLTVVGLDIDTGDPQWSVGIGEVREADVTAAGGLLVTATSAPPSGEPEPTGSSPIVTVRVRSPGDRSFVAETTVPGTGPRFVASRNDVVVLAVGRESWPRSERVLVGLRVPELSRAWQAEIVCAPSWQRQVDSSLYLAADASVRRLDIVTGRVEAETWVAPRAPDIEAGGLTVSGSRLVLSLGERQGGQWLAVIDRWTLDPLHLLRLSPTWGIGSAELLSAGTETAVFDGAGRWTGVELAGSPLPATAVAAGEAPGPSRSDDIELLSRPPERNRYGQTPWDEYRRRQEAIARLAGEPDEQSVEILEGIAFGNTLGESDLRLDALAGLGRLGSPRALCTIDARLAARREGRKPWQPHVRPLEPGGRQEQCPRGARRCRYAANAFGEPTPSPQSPDCRAGEAVSTGVGPWSRCYGPASLDLTSDDAAVRAFVGYAAAGVADLWLERRDDPAGPIFTGVTSGLALGIRDLRLTDDGVIAAVRWVEFPRGMRWAADPADVLVRDEQVRLLWSDLLRDSDRDGWSDPLERRLHTDPDAADTDEDGLEDPVDPAPRGRSPDPAACGRAEALVAAFAAVFLTEDAEIPVFVVGDESVNLQYEGYGGPVIYLAPEEANTLQEEIGLDGPTCVYLGRPWGCIDPWGRGADYPASEQIAILPGGVEAVVGVAESRGLNNQVARDVLLRCAAGRWHAVEIREMWAG